MKTIKSALLVSVFAMASVAYAQTPISIGAGGIQIGGVVAGQVNAGQAGSSSSQSFNSQAANISITTSATKTGNAITAGSSGVVATEGHAYAINQSSGTGTGDALSTGASNALVGGVAVIPGVVIGAGAAGVHNENTVYAQGNQGGENASKNNAGFDVELGYTHSNTQPWVANGTSVTNTAGITATQSGFANASTAHWNGAEMGIYGLANGPAVNNVGATGGYAAGSLGATAIGALTIPAISLPFSAH